MTLVLRMFFSVLMADALAVTVSAAQQQPPPSPVPIDARNCQANSAATPSAFRVAEGPFWVAQNSEVCEESAGVLSLQVGTAWFASSGSGDPLKIDTGNAVVTLSGKALIRIVMLHDASGISNQITPLIGTAEVSDNKGVKRVHGHALIVYSSGDRLREKKAPLTPNGFDDVVRNALTPPMPESALVSRDAAPSPAPAASHKPAPVDKASRPPHRSRAFPVTVQMQALSSGKSISVNVACGALSSRECARRAKPTKVEVCRTNKNKGSREPFECVGDATVIDFDPTPAASKGGTFAITVLLSSPIAAGDAVQITYGDSDPRPTGWEPVIPSKSEIECCDYDFDKQTVRADFDMAVIPYLEASDPSGRSRMIRVDGASDGKGNWTFDLNPSLAGDKHNRLRPGDTVTLYAIVDGSPQQLTAGTAGNQNAAPPAANAPGAAPAAPAPSAALTPSIPSTGDCADPTIDSASLTATSVTVHTGCVVRDLSKLLLYLDNVPQPGIEWQPQPAAGGPGLLYQATLSTPIQPYQQVKVLEFSPAQQHADSPSIAWQPADVPGQAPSVWWVPNPTSGCAPPAIVGKLYASDSFQAALGCSGVDPSKLYVYADNKLLSAKITLSGTTATILLAAPLQPFARVKVLQFSPPQSAADSPSVVVEGAPPAAPPPAAVTTSQTGVCATPYLPSQPSPSDSVSVVLGCMPRNPATDLSLLVDGQPPSGGVTWSLSSASPITYVAKLGTKLAAGQSVKVVQNYPLQRDPDSPAQTVAAPPGPPSTVFAVQEGSNTVTGTAAGSDKVRVQLVDGNAVQSQAPDATVDSTTGQFTATFPSPLQADQRLRAYGISKSGTVSDTATVAEVQPYGIDWGRVRGYFTAGVILSNNNSQFNLTNANSFLDFVIDKSWLRLERPFDSTGSSLRERFRIHTYFDARLTAIPVGTTGSSSSSSTPTLSSGSTGSTGATTTSTTSTSNPSLTPSSLLTNSQAAALQIGAYFPFITDTWHYKDRAYSLYVAPIAKVGFYTLTSAGSSTQQALESSNLSTGTFFPFYSYGMRFGHYREHRTWDDRNDRSRAPEQLSYLDVSVGKWANYEYIEPLNFTPTASPACTVPAIASPASAACDIRDRDWRYGFEGILVVPNTPLILGLSANLAAEHPRGPGANFLAPPDDLRFLFGVRFDASKLTGVLGKLGGQ